MAIGPDKRERPEFEDIHQMGGLGLELWETVQKQLAESYLGRYDISAYIQAVSAGTIQDTDFNHRGYLGARHWQEVEACNAQVLVPEKRGIWPLRSTHIVQRFSPEIQEARLYAKLEKPGSFTLNDHLHSSATNLGYLEWVDLEGAWCHVVRSREGRLIGQNVSWENFNPPTDWEEVEEEGITQANGDDDQFMLNRFLLTQTDVPDILHANYAEIQTALLSLAREHPEEVARRLKEQNPEYGEWATIEAYGSDFNGLCGTTEGEIVAHFQGAYAVHHGFKPHVIAYYDSGVFYYLAVPYGEKIYRDRLNDLPGVHKVAEGELEYYEDLPSLPQTLLEEPISIR